MAVNKTRTSGGKGNIGMFIERDPNICAAGVPSAQVDESVANSLQNYLLKDEVDALISDAVIPPKKPRPLPPLRRPMPLDQRHAGPFGEGPQLVNPPTKTKFQTLVEDFKNTSYTSYWYKPLGQVRDPVPMLPEGFDTKSTTFGKKTEFDERLYDIIMPKIPMVDKTPLSKQPGVQINRKYCDPPYKRDLTYGYRSFVDERGTYAKCCVTDNRIVLGTGGRTPINTIQNKFIVENQPRIGKTLAPNNNIANVPKGHSFGKLHPPDNFPECLVFCELNSEKMFFKKCFGHLNSLRKILSTRLLPTFFRDFYLNLKYYDSDKSGWLPKSKVYELSAIKHIRFDPTLIEPLLAMWDAFDGSRIKYKTFVHMINYREPSSEIPKIADMSSECFDFRTTYTEMVKPDQDVGLRFMAGVPSGRYFDMDYPITPRFCCKADRAYFPHESDAKACLNPSVLTLFHVNHRDMYAKREPEVVRRVFEATGETFTDEKFNIIWEEAAKYHSQGWVSYETFRRAMNNYKSNKNNTSNKET